MSKDFCTVSETETIIMAAEPLPVILETKQNARALLLLLFFSFFLNDMC